jgi:hypothetical protein
MNTTEPYDSRSDTLAHIERVQKLIFQCVSNLSHRGQVHDVSKLEEPEKSAFDACTLKLKQMAYGSPEYKQACQELGPALQHHYANNSHHPEFYANGIDGMSLLDLIEMLMDHKAATERMIGGGNIRRSLEINTDRFKISPQLKSILANTIKEMGW